jgi:hypothetical protein
MHNYFNDFIVTCDWGCHRRRQSAGGVDRAMTVGTAIPACHEGVVTYIAENGTGGHTATVKHPDGTKTQYMHLSEFVGASGRHVSEGEVIARSGGKKGAPGSGSSTGPHLHTHSISASGRRIAPLYEGAALASAPPVQEDSMFALVKDFQGPSIWVVSLVSGRRTLLATTYHRDLMMRVRLNTGGDPMLVGELDIIRGYLNLVNDPTIDVDALADKIQNALDEDEADRILQDIGNGVLRG